MFRNIINTLFDPEIMKDVKNDIYQAGFSLIMIILMLIMDDIRSIDSSIKLTYLMMPRIVDIITYTEIIWVVRMSYYLIKFGVIYTNKEEKRNSQEEG